MPLAAKAAWEVRAGLIPNEARPEFSRRWVYTSLDKAKDDAITKPEEHAIFAKMRAEALDYYLQVSQPGMNNWAELQFIWY